MLFRLCFFFFKQKTAYEMRISDWSSDVCSSDLHSLALDRLDDEGGDVAALRAARQRRLERGKIIEGDLHAVRQQRAEALAEDLAAVQREGAVGEAVEGVVAVEDLRPAGRHAGELDRGFHRLGAGVAEEHAPDRGPADARQPLTGQTKTTTG